MAVGDYKPGDMLKKVLSEPGMAQEMREVDQYAGTNILGLYNNLDETRKRLDYLDVMRQSAQNRAPSDIMPPSVDINSDLSSGDALTGPRKRSDYDNSENIKNLMNQLDDVSQLSQDPYQWAKPYSFNTGVYGADFDRYYTHPLYSKLGYSPFRDNDQAYNNKSSWLDDNRRMWGQWLGLTWQGIKPMWGGSSDVDEFNRRQQIAQSSKDGVGAFTTNLLSNFSYTVGVAASFLVQEAALAFGVAATGGTASGAIIPGMAASGARAAKILGLAKDFKTSKKILEGANNARNVYNAAKGAKSAFNIAERLGAPVQGIKSLYAIGKGFKGYDNLTTLAKLSTTTGAFLRDIVALNGAYAESSLEGDGEQVKFADDLIGKYYKDNGRMPTGKDADHIYDLAKEAGFKTKLYNMPLLMMTNNVVFGKAFRGFTPKWLADAHLTGKIPVETIKNVNWKKAGIEAYQVAPDGYKKFMMRNYWKQRPTRIVAGMLNYGKANFFEGAQESMQEIIAGSIDEYYKGVYRDPSLAGAKQYWAAFKNGTAAQVSGQGLEVFLSGFLMGGLLQVPQNLIMGYMPRITMGKTKYEDYKARRKAQGDAVIDALNSVVMETGKYASLIEENLVYQKNLAKTMQAAEAANDRKGYQDAKNASMFTHIRTLIDHEQYDVFLDSMKEMREWSDQELSDAFNAKAEGDIDNKDIRQRLEDSIAEVEHIKNRYDNFSERFSNPFDPDLYNKETDREKWQDEMDRRNAFEDVKFHAIYGNYAFEKALSRMSSILNDLSTTKQPFSNFSTTDIMPLFDPIQTQNRRKALVDEIKVYSEGDATQKQMASKLSKKLEAFDKLADQIAAYRKAIDASRQPIAEALTPEQELKKIEEFETLNKSLADAYLKYIKVLAAETNQQVLDVQVYPSLNGIKDYMELDKDSRSMAQFINHLHDPTNFTTSVNRRYESIRKEMREMEAEVRKSLDKFLDMSDQNGGVFGRIGDAGAWMYQDSIDAFMREEDEKIIFQHLDAPYGQVEVGSKKYKNLMKIIADYRSTTKPPAEKVTETPITIKGLSPEMEKRVREVIDNKNFIKLTPDEKNYVNTKTGKIYQRVSNFISTKAPDDSLLLDSAKVIGSKVDVLVRDFFAGNLKDLSTYDIAAAPKVEAFLAQLQKIKENMTERGEEVLANDIILYNDEIGVAGTVDLLTYDKEGNIRIYDMKTMRGNQFEDVHKRGENEGKVKYYNAFNPKEDSNEEKHTKQLSMYRILLNNTHGLKAKTIGIMPIEVFYKRGDSTTSELTLLPGVQLTALDTVKTAKLDTTKETVSAPIPGVAGEIIYLTPTIDKEPLIAKMPDKYKDGDEILLDYLKILAPEFKAVKLPESPELAGFAFTNFLRGNPDAKKYVKEIKDIFRKEAAEGKVILTSNWFVIDKADPSPLATKMLSSTDKIDIMEKLRAMGTSNVESRAKSILEQEAAFRKKFPILVQELPTDILLEDVLEKKKPSKEAGRLAMIEKINTAADLDSLNKLKESITEFVLEDPDYLSRYGLDSKEITNLINDRRDQLVKHPIFASIKVGSILLMKDGSRMYVDAKTSEGVPLVKRPGSDSINKMKEKDLKNIDRVVAQDEPIPKTKAPSVTKTAKEASASTLKNQKDISNNPDSINKIRTEAEKRSKKDIDDDFMNSVACD